MFPCEYIHVATLHATDWETALLAKHNNEEKSLYLLRIIPRHSEILKTLMLCVGQKSRGPLTTYVSLYEDAVFDLLFTVEEPPAELSISTRIIRATLASKPISEEEVCGIFQGIMAALDSCRDQFIDSLESNVNIECLCASSLTIHNVGLPQDYTPETSLVSCTFRGPGLIPCPNSSNISFSTQLGRLIYCLLVTSLQDSLPVSAMIAHLEAARHKMKDLGRYFADLACFCLQNPSTSIKELQERMLIIDTILPKDPGCRDISPPSFALSPQRSPSPLPLSLSELLLENQQHYTPLMLAVLSGQLHTAKIVYKDFLRKRNVHRNTALMLAVLCNNPQMVELLASHEYGCTNAEGDTALLIAVSNGFYECCLPLLPYELDVPNSVTGMLPKTLAFTLNQREILQAIFTFQAVPVDSEGCTALMRGVLNGSPIDDLIIKQFGCTHKQANGYTALMFAIVNGNNSACEKLVKYEGNIPDHTGKYPLEVAILSRKDKCALILLDHSTELDGHTINIPELAAFIAAGQWKEAEQAFRDTFKPRVPTPLQLSSAYKHSAPPPTKLDGDGNTQLMQLLLNDAFDAQHPDAQSLVQRQAGHRNLFGETALLIAIAKGLESVIPLLLPYEMHICDRNGYLPFRRAVMLQSAETVGTILSTLQLPKGRGQQLYIINLLETGDWDALTHFLEESPDTCKLL